MNDPHWRQVMDHVERHMKDAQLADDTATTVFYGDYALVVLLGAILQELKEINTKLSKTA